MGTDPYGDRPLWGQTPSDGDRPQTKMGTDPLWGQTPCSPRIFYIDFTKPCPYILLSHSILIYGKEVKRERNLYGYF